MSQSNITADAVVSDIRLITWPTSCGAVVYSCRVAQRQSISIKYTPAAKSQTLFARLNSQQAIEHACCESVLTRLQRLSGVQIELGMRIPNV